MERAGVAGDLPLVLLQSASLRFHRPRSVAGLGPRLVRHSKQTTKGRYHQSIVRAGAVSIS